MSDYGFAEAERKENEKLRKRIEKLEAEIRTLDAKLTRIEIENAKLRELVKDYALFDGEQAAMEGE